MNTSLSRKRFLQGSAAAVAAALVAPRAALANTAAASTGSRAMQLTQTWDKTFPEECQGRSPQGHVQEPLRHHAGR